MQFLNQLKIFVFASLCVSTLCAAKDDTIKVPLNKEEAAQYSSDDIKFILAILRPFGVKQIFQESYTVSGNVTLSQKEVQRALFFGLSGVKAQVALRQDGLPSHYQQHGLSALIHDTIKLSPHLSENRAILANLIHKGVFCFVSLQTNREKIEQKIGSQQISPLSSEEELGHVFERFDQYHGLVRRINRSTLERFFSALQPTNDLRASYALERLNKKIPKRDFSLVSQKPNWFGR